jgi:hypothetical protein
MTFKNVVLFTLLFLAPCFAFGMWLGIQLMQTH